MHILTGTENFVGSSLRGVLGYCGPIGSNASGLEKRDGEAREMWCNR